MSDPATIQLALEAILGAACIVGYRVESARAKLLPPAADPNRSIEELRVVGDGEWAVLGSSEEVSFESVSATPEFVSEGFELDGPRGRVMVPKGAKVRIVALDGARRAPLDAITREGSVRPRFTFELKPGTVVYTDAALPALQAYRAEPMSSDVSIIVGGKEDVVRAAANPGSFPGCWIMILIVGVVSAFFGTFAGYPTFAWICIAASLILIVFGWAAMPPSNAEKR